MGAVMHNKTAALVRTCVQADAFLLCFELNCERDEKKRREGKQMRWKNITHHQDHGYRVSKSVYPLGLDRK